MLDEICIALWFKFVRVFETCCFFSKVMEGLDFITLYVALSPGQVESIMGGGVAMPQESSQRFGLRTSKDNAVMTLLSGNASTFGVVKVVHFECTPSGTSKRALEKYWFGQSQPSTDGEAEFSIEKS